MTILGKLLQNTWTGKLVNLLKNINSYSKDYALISDTLYSKEFNLVLKRYLNTDFEKDWIGRLYGVINPVIDIDGKMNFSNVILEIDGENTNSTEYVKSWVFKQLQLIGDLFKIHNLYDYISIEFRHVGPETQDNFLIIFDITSRINMMSSLKKFLKHTILYLVIAAAAATTVMFL
jgi:hypothetical protein